jgi:DNA polymerase III epsilon subunit-like protein
MTARLAFLDTETTSLRPDRRAWEIGVIVRVPVTVKHPDAPDTREDEDREYHWFVETGDLDLGNADPMALKIGGFYERHPQCERGLEGGWGYTKTEEVALREVETVTRGAHLVGAVVSFDADVLGQRMRAHGICPSWHYHLIDVEPLAVGWLNGRRARQNEIVDGYPLENNGEPAPGLVRWNSPGPWDVPLPWKSDNLSAALGITVSDKDRHTALGDARWARAIYDKVTGAAS